MRARLVALTGLALTTGAGTAQAAFPGRDGLLTIGRRDVQTEAVDGGRIQTGEQEYLQAINPRTGKATRIRTCSQPNCGVGMPEYSPDGKQLISLNRLTGAVITKADGSDPRNVGLGYLTASWSRRGTQLVVSQGIASNQNDLVIVRTDGTGGRRITYRSGADAHWSSRDEIAFSRGYPRSPEICVIRVAGGKARCIIKGGSSPDWAPDGRHLVYTTRTGAVASADRRGRARRVLVRRGTDPVWSPSGRQIAFGRDGWIFTLELRSRAVRKLARYGDHLQGLDWQSRGRR